MKNIETVKLNDPRYFRPISGLWQSDREPLRPCAVLRSTNFRPDGFFDYSNVARFAVDSRQLSQRQLQHGDIVVERSGGGPKQPVGRVALFEQTTDEAFCTSNFTTALRILDSSTFDSRFVAFYLLHLYRSGETKALQRATTGLRNLDWSSYLEFEVPRLSIEEQRDIADFLETLRRAGPIQVELGRVLNDLKRHTMTRLFTRGIGEEKQKESEIGMIPESWAAQSLAAICTMQSGGTPPKSDLTHWAGTHPWVSGKDLKVNRLVDSTDHISEEAARTFSKIAPTGSVLVLVRGMGLVKGFALSLIERPMAFNQDLKALIPTGDVDGPFLMHALSYAGQRMLQNVSDAAHGTKRLSQSDLDQFIIPVPLREEQNEISAILDALDQTIDLHLRRKRVLETLFQALLIKLMTGDVRIGELDRSRLQSSRLEEAIA
jgi:type I restriction enzyme, S subunit